MAQTEIDFPLMLQKLNVTIKSPMMNRQPIQRQASIGDYQRILSSSHPLPTDFLQFLVQVGPGTLGNVRIFGITQPLSQFDLRFHTHRLQQLHANDVRELNEEYEERNVKLNKNRIADHSSFIFFAQDRNQEDLWFAYKQRTTTSDDDQVQDDEIFVVDTHPEALMQPPRRICKKGFEQFVAQVCLGDRLRQKEIVSTRRLAQQQEDDEMSDESEEDEEEKVYTFLPFSQP